MIASEKAAAAKGCSRRIADTRRQRHLISHTPNNVLRLRQPLLIFDLISRLSCGVPHEQGELCAIY
jgi:hypothetical protein